MLKVDLPPYVDIGAIRVPQTLTKRRLILQTGLDLFCGPGAKSAPAITMDMNS